LPASEKRKNVGGRDGSGLCVFTSIEYCARWANERPLFDFQDKMRQEDGGGWPEKVDAMLEKYAPGITYLQSTTGDLGLLRAALKTGRQVGVTYNGRDPHYKTTIAHMVTLEHLSEKWACITDNNFPGETERVWMSPSEFKKRHDGGAKGWSVILLHCAPPPPPKAR
jgi:hypothetical protein